MNTPAPLSSASFVGTPATRDGHTGPALAVPATHHPRTSPVVELASAINVVLRELHAMLGAISDEKYTQPSSAQFMRATIGGHMRHSIDHLAALVDGLIVGVVAYDRRARGTPIETDRNAAATELARLATAFEALSDADPARPLTVEVMATRAGAFQAVTSTLARELAFVLSHTVHHQATLRGMVVACGVTVPDNFGFANATIAHKDAGPCAR
ncbi:MAG: DinB family protein [Phycisphaerales bacterium]|nr:DinB family protein [Phycisphaerales bacterium]